VKTTRLSLAAAAIIFAGLIAWSCYTSNRVSAQQPAPSYGPPTAQRFGPVCLVDVNIIFKRHVRLKAQMDDLKKEAEAVQKGFEHEQQELQALRQQLNGMHAGTPDYQRTEEQCVSREANFRGQMALKRKEFVQKEAHLYYNAYLEISEEVRYFCEKNGISLVLNFNGDKIHEENPDDIARGIGNKVVFFQKNLDITGFILPRFEQPLSSGPQGPAGGMAFPPQPYSGQPLR
jgi:Skp family chaperone for outer membrane proteins